MATLQGRGTGRAQLHMPRGEWHFLNLQKFEILTQEGKILPSPRKSPVVLETEKPLAVDTCCRAPAICCAVIKAHDIMLGLSRKRLPFFKYMAFIIFKGKED